MAFASGDRITASRMNNLQTRVFYAIGSGTIAASQTNADVTDATVTFTTLTDNATYMAFCVWDYDSTGTPGGDGTARLNVDAVNQNPLATFGGINSSQDRGTVAQNYSGTLTTAGSHTLKLVASTNTNMQVLGVNCSILVLVEEVA